MEWRVQDFRACDESLGLRVEVRAQRGLFRV